MTKTDPQDPGAIKEQTTEELVARLKTFKRSEWIDRPGQPVPVATANEWNEALDIAKELGERLTLLEPAYLEERETPFDSDEGRQINLGAYCIRCGSDLEHLEKINEEPPGKFRTSPVGGYDDWCAVCWDQRQPIPSNLRRKLEKG